MKELSFKEYKIGMRVVFTNKKSGYNICKSNPLVGTTHECHGTVKYLDFVSKDIYVTWDNEKDNTYKDIDLTCLKYYSAHNKEEIAGGHIVSIW